MLSFTIRRGTEIVFVDQTGRDRFGVSLLRTLRLPDDGVRYPLPPGMGPLPLRDVAELAGKVPPAWLAAPGVVVPMYRSEAMWLLFSSDQPLPHAVKVGCGGINALSGRPLSRQLTAPVRPGLWRRMLGAEAVQDYAVCPPQQFIDGFNTGHHSVRQFVAVPLGEGKTVEAQLTGREQHGGIQLCVYPPRRERALALSRVARPASTELVAVNIEGSELDAETPAWEWIGPGEPALPPVPPVPPVPRPLSERSGASGEALVPPLSEPSGASGEALVPPLSELFDASGEALVPPLVVEEEPPIQWSKELLADASPASPSIAGAWRASADADDDVAKTLDLTTVPTEVTLRGHVAATPPNRPAAPMPEPAATPMPEPAAAPMPGSAMPMPMSGPAPVKVPGPAAPQGGPPATPTFGPAPVKVPGPAAPQGGPPATATFGPAPVKVPGPAAPQGGPPATRVYGPAPVKVPGPAVPQGRPPAMPMEAPAPVAPQGGPPAMPMPAPAPGAPRGGPPAMPKGAPAEEPLPVMGGRGGAPAMPKGAPAEEQLPGMGGGGGPPAPMPAPPATPAPVARVGGPVAAKPARQERQMAARGELEEERLEMEMERLEMETEMRREAPAGEKVRREKARGGARLSRGMARPGAALPASSAMPMPQGQRTPANERQASGGVRVQPAADRGMGIGAGGQISQTIYADPYGIEIWDEAACTEVFIHIVSPRTWHAMTGEPPPPTPVTFRAYQAASLPWFQIYDEDQAGIGPSPELAQIRSIDELDRRR
jgi:hypothetical protein